MPYPGHHHPRISRRTALQAGAVGLLGMGMNHLEAFQAAPLPAGVKRPAATAKRVIYIFLSGGLAQHDSFDMKPDAADDVRGEFKPIQTRTPGLQICEHLPQLAERSEMFREMVAGEANGIIGEPTMLQVVDSKSPVS